jgi:hypothetical protein
MNKLNGNFTGKNDSHSTKKGSMEVHFFAHWRVALPILIVLFTFGILLAALGNGEPARAGVTTNVQGTIITDTVWILAESPYVVTGDVIVNPDITLTIEPGVKVSFDGNYALFVNGTLLAKGNTAQSITFTSNKNSPAPGDWGMIDFRDTSKYSVLSHVVIEYGGNATRSGDLCISGVLCVSTSSFVLDTSTIQHNATRGLVLRQSDAVISNNTFTDHPNEAIRLHSCNHNIGPCRPSIIGNTFTDNASPIYRVDALDPIISFNQASDNDINGFILKTPCKFVDANTWYADDLTYVVETGHCYVGGSGDVSLTLQPGIVVKFGPAGGLKVFSDNYYTATISATGTTEQPIVFTSLKDDSVGGDTNNDGNTTSPAVGDWELLWLEGDKTRGTFEHAEIRYARAGGASWRPGFLVDYGATLSMKNSHLRFGEVGIKFYRPGFGANGQIENTTISEMSTAGVLVESDGDVSISNNRFEDNGVGVYVSKGHPTVSDSFFSGNNTGVEVNCIVATSDCAPVISPHNSFADTSQQAIINKNPVELCVAARYNWWGDKNGPQDSSSSLDACALEDNPGAGAIVSDGVDYSPWDGGLARPLIARPGCGVTGRNRPTFTGRAQSGATVSFYDGDTKIGQTTAATEDTFNWTPSTPLEDGEHIIIAVASLGGETSLPSPDLQLTVDSTLPFDPAGVLISYATHSAVHTQTLKDSTGCASIMGDLDTSFWVRPGSTMTVTIPIRTDLVPGTVETADPSPASGLTKSSLDTPTAIEDSVTRTVTNNSNHTITGFLYAQKESNFGDQVYQPYQADSNFISMQPGDVRTMTFDSEIDVIFETDNGYGHQERVLINPADTSDINIKYHYRGSFVLSNQSTHKLKYLYLRHRDMMGEKNFGGSLINPEFPLPFGQSFPLKLPEGHYDVVIRDSDNTFYWRYINVKPVPNIVHKMSILDSDPGVNFTIQNNGPTDICQVRMYRYDDLDKNSMKPPIPIENTPNLLDFFGGNIAKEVGSISFKLEPGRYFIEAKDCDNKTVFKGSSVQIQGSDQAIPIGKLCNTIGSVKVGNKEYPISCPNNPNMYTSSTAVWSDCYSVIEAAADTLGISICELGNLWDLLMGIILIDPDGYVYDAARGIEAVIQSATVTCDMYDEDYQTWERWPAELYEAQINPQVTGSDGYYAFFVPPGRYRVRAVAAGYESHTSPDILVIDEIVHYNIPMTSGGGLYLPFVVR